MNKIKNVVDTKIKSCTYNNRTIYGTESYDNLSIINITKPKYNLCYGYFERNNIKKELKNIKLK